MHARKWVSNSEKVMEVIPEDRATEVNIMGKKDTVTTTLGLQWYSTEDEFVIPATLAPVDYSILKRNILKKVATVFDPLGLVSPLIMQAKFCSKSCGTEVMIVGLLHNSLVSQWMLGPRAIKE